MEELSVLDLFGERRYELKYEVEHLRKSLLQTLRKPLSNHTSLIEKLVKPPHSLLHLPVIDSSHALLDIVSNAIDGICGKSNSSSEAVDVLWRQQALFSALEDIRIHGNRILRDTLTNYEWGKVMSYNPRCEKWDANGELGCFIDSMDGLFDDLTFTFEGETRTQSAYLAPRGLAVHSYFFFRSNAEQQKALLNRTISESYKLPNPDSYEFLAWKYIYPLSSHITIQPYVWDIYKTPLMDLIRPLVPAAGVDSLASDEYLSMRTELVESGIPKGDLRNVEWKYASAAADDRMRRSIRALDFATPIVANTIKFENRDLYENLRQGAKTLVKDLIAARDCEMELSAVRKRTLDTLCNDAMMHAVYYDLVYDWKPLIRESFKSLSPGKKRVIREKAVIDIVKRDYVRLIHATDIDYPWDYAAKVLNALSGNEIYSTLVSEGSDTRTTGGAVLRQECIRESK